MSNLVLDVGQANELKQAFCRAGFTEEDVARLCKGGILSDVLRLLRGNASITVIQYIIDCDAQPFVPDGWSVEEHQKGGAFKWDKETQKDAFCLSKGQAGSKYIKGDKLYKELTEKSTPVLNANVLDYLLANPHLIPEEWEGKNVFFWGTVYRSRVSGLYVRYLCWGDGRWGWSRNWLDDVWNSLDPAAVRAS